MILQEATWSPISLANEQFYCLQQHLTSGYFGMLSRAPRSMPTMKIPIYHSVLFVFTMKRNEEIHIQPLRLREPTHRLNFFYCNVQYQIIYLQLLWPILDAKRNLDNKLYQYEPFSIYYCMYYFWDHILIYRTLLNSKEYISFSLT